MKLFLSISLPLMTGLFGSFFTTPAINGWYENLIKPIFNPPNWIFGPVWTILYILMGVSIYLVWSAHLFFKKKRGQIAFNLFWLHLFFNAIWSIIFFYYHNIGLALFDIIIVWCFIVVLIVQFWKINRLASCLLIPYFLWVSFASILNFSIWILN